MVAEIQRLENAARVAMGDIQAPDQTIQQPHPASDVSVSLVAAALAMVGVVLVVFALI
jgi:hypothetical protein